METNLGKAGPAVGTMEQSPSPQMGCRLPAPKETNPGSDGPLSSRACHLHCPAGSSGAYFGMRFFFWEGIFW
jgi:hypothetical protein